MREKVAFYIFTIAGVLVVAFFIILLVVTIKDAAETFGLVNIKREETAVAISPYDLNQDGQVTDKDASLLMKIIEKEVIATQDMLDRCDVNKDGIVDEEDLHLVSEVAYGKD